MAKTKAELEKEFEAYKAETEGKIRLLEDQFSSKEKQLKKRLLLSERQLSEKDKAHSELNDMYLRLHKNYKKLEKEHDQLKQGHFRKLYNSKVEQNNALQAKLDEANNKIKELEEQIYIMGDETESTKCIISLLGQKVALEKQVGDYNLLRKKYEELVRENEHLHKEIEELKKYNKIHKVGGVLMNSAEYEELHDRYEELLVEFDKKDQAYKSLENMCVEYKNKYDDLYKKYDNNITWSEGRIRELSALCDKYGDECDELKEMLDKRNNDYMDLSLAYDKLEFDLENEKAKSKFIPLPPRPDFPALLKRYADLQKDHEQLDKDFKDLYGRYEAQKKRIAELVSIVDDKYDTIWHLKTKLSEHESGLSSLEHEFNIKAENIYDILNAWFAVSERLEIVKPILYADNLEYKLPDYIVMTGRINSYTDPKKYEIVKKAMDIKSWQSK